jgi:hypothetical protein
MAYVPPPPLTYTEALGKSLTQQQKMDLRSAAVAKDKSRPIPITTYVPTIDDELSKIEDTDELTKLSNIVRKINAKLVEVEQKINSPSSPPTPPPLIRATSIQTTHITTNQTDEGTCFAHAQARLYVRNVFDHVKTLNIDERITTPFTRTDEKGRVKTTNCLLYLNTADTSGMLPRLREINEHLCTPKFTTFIYLFWSLYLIFVKNRALQRKPIHDFLEKIPVSFEALHVDQQSPKYKYFFEYYSDVLAIINRDNLKFRRVDFFLPELLYPKFTTTGEFKVREMLIETFKKILNKGLYLSVAMKSIEQHLTHQEYHMHIVIIVGHDGEHFLFKNSWGPDELDKIKYPDIFNTFKLNQYPNDWKITIVSTIMQTTMTNSSTYDVVPTDEQINKFNEDFFTERGGTRKSKKRNKKSKRILKK